MASVQKPSVGRIVIFREMPAIVTAVNPADPSIVDACVMGPGGDTAAEMFYGITYGKNWDCWHYPPREEGTIEVSE